MVGEPASSPTCWPCRVQGGQRFELEQEQLKAGPHPWRFMTVFDIETDDLRHTFDTLISRVNTPLMPMSPYRGTSDCLRLQGRDAQGAGEAARTAAEITGSGPAPTRIARRGDLPEDGDRHDETRSGLWRAPMNIPCAMRRTSPWRNCMRRARAARWTTPA